MTMISAWRFSAVVAITSAGEPISSRLVTGPLFGGSSDCTWV